MTRAQRYGRRLKLFLRRWVSRCTYELRPVDRALVAVILGGYAVRWLVMPFSGQFDALFLPTQANLILHGMPNLYDAVYRTFGEAAVTPVPWIVYLPAYYFIVAPWVWLLSHLGLIELPLVTALASPGIDASLLAARLAAAVHTTAAPLPVTLFWLKLVYLPFDVLIGYMLYRMTGRRLIAWAVWATYPIAIFTSFVMGQNDVLPTFFVVLSLFFAWQALGRAEGRRSDVLAVAAMVALGLGGAVKSFPLLLVPIAAIVLGRNRVMRTLALGVAGVAPFVLIVAPFLRTPAFVRLALLNPEGMRLLGDPSADGEMSVLDAAVRTPFLSLYCAALLGVAVASKEFGVLWRGCLVVLLALFTTTVTPGYWHVWLAPLVVLAVVAEPRALAFVVVATAYTAIVLVAGHLDLGLAAFSVASAEFVSGIPLADRLRHALPIADPLPYLVNAARVALLVAAGGLALWAIVGRRDARDAWWEGWSRSRLVAWLGAPLVVAGMLLVGEMVVSRDVVGACVHLPFTSIADWRARGSTTLTLSSDATSGLAMLLRAPRWETVTVKAELAEVDGDGAAVATGETTARMGAAGEQWVAVPVSGDALEQWRVYRATARVETPAEARLALVSPSQPRAPASMRAAQPELIAVALHPFDPEVAATDIARGIGRSRGFFVAWALAPAAVLVAYVGLRRRRRAGADAA